MKLKEEYKNATIRRGNITFNPNKIDKYEFYYNNGFADLFMVETTTTTTTKKSKKIIENEYI